MKHDRKKNKRSSGGKGPGFEYWGTRDSKECRDPGKSTKVLTHRRERRKGKLNVHKEEGLS